MGGLGERLREAAEELRERALGVAPAGDRTAVVLRGAAWAVMALWGLRLATLPIAEGMESWLHWIHLPFHEAGHLVFSPFGDFLHILGGTLGQLLVPLVVAFAFLARRDAFGASFGAWWLGASLIDCAPYVNDARARNLLLTSGETGQTDWEGHDWYQILSRTGLLTSDHTLARFFWLLGVLTLVAALAWGAHVLRRQWGIGGR